MFDCTCPAGTDPFARRVAVDTARVCAQHGGRAALRRAITQDFAGRIAVVSSFGAESALLLALVAEIDPATPVLFVDTGQHFAETLAYRDELTRFLGLSDVRNIGAERGGARGERSTGPTVAIRPGCMLPLPARWRRWTVRWSRSKPG